MEYFMHTPEKDVSRQVQKNVILPSGLVKPPLDMRVEQMEENIRILVDALNQVISKLNEIGNTLSEKGII